MKVLSRKFRSIIIQAQILRLQERELRYIATPRAIKDYNNDGTTRLVEGITETQTQFDVTDGSSLTADSYIAIKDELMYIKKITGNTILVRRGEDGTSVDFYDPNQSIDLVNSVDDNN